jgi:hypothetical protein
LNSHKSAGFGRFVPVSNLEDYFNYNQGQPLQPLVLDPAKIAADRIQHADTVDATYSHYYVTIYQEATERTHSIWGAAATRDANIGSS